MPRASQRKKKHPIAKRVEITDEDGWTRVTSSNRDQQFPNRIGLPEALDESSAWITTPEDGITIERLQDEYAKVERGWRESESSTILKTLFRDRILKGDLQIDKCIIFGSGSFCGLRQGWISLRTAAMVQLAALKDMQNIIGQITGDRVPAYAQDPAYNDIDTEFLRVLGVEVVHHPRGFNLLTSKSLAYTPMAELHVELQTLEAKPAIRLGSKLDFYWRNEKGLACTHRVSSQTGGGMEKRGEADTNENGSEQQMGVTGRFASIEEECRCFESFLHEREEASVPQFDLKDAKPFHGQHLYWPRAIEHDT